MVLKSRNLLPAQVKKPHLYLAPLGKDAQPVVFSLTIQLRENNWLVETDFQGRSLKAQMKTADKLGVRLVGVIGDDELKNNQILIRMMETGEQELIAQENLKDFLNRYYTV